MKLATLLRERRIIMLIKEALICVFVYWATTELQTITMFDIIHNPICLGTLMGVLSGKPTEGLIMGGYLQAIFLGVMAVGGVTPTNKMIGTIVPCAFVLMGGMDRDAALAIAYTVGIISNSFGSIFTPFFIASEGWWKKLALKADSKKYALAHWIWMLFIKNISACIIIFVTVAFGTEGIQALITKLPPKVMKGLSAASGCMTSVGIGIAMVMTWQKKYAGFFFIGWLFYTVFNKSMIMCAFFAIAVGAVWFFVSDSLDKKIEAAGGSKPAQRGGDFF